MMYLSCALFFFYNIMIVIKQIYMCLEIVNIIYKRSLFNICHSWYRRKISVCLFFFSLPQRWYMRRTMTEMKSPRTFGRKRAGSSSARTLMRKVLCGSNWTRSTSLFRCRYRELWRTPHKSTCRQRHNIHQGLLKHR